MKEQRCWTNSGADRSGVEEVRGRALVLKGNLHFCLEVWCFRRQIRRPTQYWPTSAGGTEIKSAEPTDRIWVLRTGKGNVLVGP